MMYLCVCARVLCVLPFIPSSFVVFVFVRVVHAESSMSPPKCEQTFLWSVLLLLYIYFFLWVRLQACHITVLL